MKILITGVAGFMGSHLQNSLIRDGHEVVGVDNLIGGFRRNLNPKTRFYLANLSDTDHVDRIFIESKPEVVFHLGADATEGRSQFTPVGATRDNMVSSINVFKSSANHGVKRIIFTSSMAVYGEQTPPFSEDMSRLPEDIYGINKAAVEQSLEVLADVHGMEYVIIRPHNVFGERQRLDDPYRNVIGIFINRIMQGKPPLIYGDGEQTRAFSYIGNVNPCIVRTLDCPSGQIINVGPTQEYSINHLASTVLSAMGSSLKPEHVPDRPKEIKHAYCTVDKARSILGYEDVFTFEQGIARMVAWAKELGPQKFRYMTNLEIKKGAPSIWTEKQI